MKPLKKFSRALLAMIASLFFVFAPVSDGFIGESTTNAADTWTYPCGVASYYYNYYTYFGQYNDAAGLFYLYDGLGHHNFYVSEGQAATGSFYLNNGYSLYYYFLYTGLGDTASANGYYLLYQGYAYYNFYLLSGDQTTADAYLAAFLLLSSAAFGS